MQTRSFGEFMASLPGLVNGVGQVVVATYNSVDRHDEGVRTLANGKDLRILCGGGSYRRVEVLPGIALPVPGADESVRAGASKVIVGMSGELTRALVVLYAGLTQFDRMLALARRIAQNSNTVVILGCGCPNNSRQIRDLSEIENVIAVIPEIQGMGCEGGRDCMGDIVDALAGMPAEVTA